MRYKQKKYKIEKLKTFLKKIINKNTKNGKFI